MGKVFLVASGKGGTGKTVVAANLGATLAKKGSNVLLIDMANGFRNLDLVLGMENQIVYDINDVFAGICRLKQAIVKYRKLPRLYLMSVSQQKSKDNMTAEQFKTLCRKLCTKFDYVIADCPPGAGKEVSVAASAADRAIIVTTPEYAAVRDADMMDRKLIEAGVSKRFYIINMMRADLTEKGFLPSLDQIAELLKPSIAGIIQYDENIFLSANSGVPIVLKPDTYIEHNFSNIAGRIL